MSRSVHLWSGSGKYLYANEQNGAVAVWDVAAEKVVHLLGGHTAPVRDMHLHPSGGELLATCGFDKTVRIWSSDTVDAAVATPGGAGGVVAGATTAAEVCKSERPADMVAGGIGEHAVPHMRRLEL